MPDKFDDELWRRMLQEDTGEADQYLPVMERLQKFAAPQPAPLDTARLITALLPEMPVPAKVTRPWNWQSWLLLVRVQARVVRGEIWLASALVIALGTLVTLTSYNHLVVGQTLPLVLVAPLVSAMGIAFLYNPEIEPVPEIERATPISPSLLLLARLVLLFGFNLVLGLLGSGLLALLLPGISLWPLIMTWLAPMTFLSALALFLSVVFDEPLVGVAVSLALWALQTLARFAEIYGWPLTFDFPDLTSTNWQPWLLLATLPLGGLALWLAGRSESWLNHLKRD